MANKIVKSDYLALKKFNQKTEKGDIFERDIMTINPLEDLFTPGQDIIYSDSNFKFSVRTDQDKTKKHTKNAWLKNADGEEVWNLTDVDSSPISEESEVVIKPNYSSIKDFAYYGSAVEMIRATVNHAIMYFPAELYFSEQTLNDYLGLVSSSETISDFGDYLVIPNDLEIDIKTDLIEESEVNNPYRYLCVYGGSYEVYDNSGQTNHIGVTCVYTENEDYKCGDGVLGSAVITESGDGVLGYAEITENTESGVSFTITVYSYNNKEYLIYNDSSYTGYSVRPNNAIVNEYFATIDEFEKVLLNKETKPLYKAIFETPYETDEGNKYTLESYIWPSRNNWNPIVDGGGYEMYIGSLIKLASFHDEYDSNIIWRMLTHEAIKNLDWTFFRENGSDVEDLSKIDSSKIEAFLQLYGRQFDGLKRYIDSIKYTNNVTYDQKNNLPDYMLTDVVENSGFEATLPNATAKTDATSDVLYPSKSVGSSEVDANTQFMRNLKINAPYINSLKGTRYGVETILKLCGLKDKEFEITEYVAFASGSSEQCEFSDDLSYGDNFYPRPSGVTYYPSVKDVISININKGDGTVDDMETYFDGIPVKPFRCVDRSLWCGNTPTYYAIPWYENGKHYDGGWYFQSKGGWAKRRCEKVDNSVVPSGVTELCYCNINDSIIYDESESSLKYAETVSEMKGFFKTEIKDKMVCYVTSLENWDEYSADVTSHYFIYNESGDTWDNISLDEIRNGDTYNGKKVVYLENIKESTKGNNPHIGNDEYDDGKEYLEYMNQIFKYSLDNNDFPRFSQKDIEKIEQYYKFNIGNLEKDNRKCDYFFDPNANSVLSAFTSAITISSYTYDKARNPETIESGRTDEEPAANSIINVKNLHLEIKKEISSNPDVNEKWQDYVTNVVMSYVKQMLPSTVIFEWKFSGGTTDYCFNWSNGSSAITSINVSDTGAILISGYSTNYENLEFTSDQTWCNVTSGVSSVTASITENTDTASTRTAVITVSSSGVPIGIWRITQNAKACFMWNGGTSATTVEVSSASTTTSKQYTTNMSGLSLSYSGCVTGATININNNTVTAYYTGNLDRNPREGGIVVMSGSTVVGTFGIKQEAKEPFKPNLKVNGSSGSTSISSGTSAFTITTLPNDLSESYTICVGSTTITKTGAYSGNYTCGSNTETTDRTFNVICCGETVTVTQKAKAYFKWSDGSTATTETVSSASTTTSKHFTTNYENLTVTHTDYITDATISENSVIVTYPVNTGITQQEGTVEVKSNGVTIGVYDIKQNGKDESVELYLNGTHGNITIGSGATSITINVKPSANDFKYKILVNGTTEWDNLLDETTHTYNCPANSETTARTFTIKAVTNNSHKSDEHTVTQEAKAYFEWSNGSTSVTETVNSEITSSTKYFTTNYTGLTTSESSDWITGASINNEKVIVNYTENSETNDRTGSINIMNGLDVVGTYTITQKGKEQFKTVTLPVRITDTSGIQRGILNIVGEGGVDVGNVYNFNGMFEQMTNPISITLHEGTDTTGFTFSVTFNNEIRQARMAISGKDTGYQTNVRYLELNGVRIDNWESPPELMIEIYVN